ncbi:MAG: shikimate dehydrogenase [Georgfuchsia sp.]
MTDRYAVFGNPVAHSQSPRIHALFAQQTGQDLRYEAILAPLDGFEQSVRELIANGGCGANVTVPFKEEAFRLATQLTMRAKAAGAVNTLIFVEGPAAEPPQGGAAMEWGEPGSRTAVPPSLGEGVGGKASYAIVGDNTDGAGLINDIQTNIGFPIAGKRVLLLGAGGAARGAVLPLLHESPGALVIANRTLEKALRLVDTFSSDAQGILSGSAFPALAGQSFDLVINATSAGLANAELPLPGSIFAPGCLAYEMVYGRETAFMRQAANAGVGVADGLGMLVEQAAEAFFVWRGMRPDTASVLNQLRNA